MDNEKIISEARKLGIVNECKVRNIKIQEEFKRLRMTGYSYEQSLEILADKYFRSRYTIEQIILHGKSK